jgi:hypothetical protein
MSPKSVATEKSLMKLRKRLLFIPIIALVIKISIISRIQGFDWYSAGGSDLIKGLGLLLDNNYIPANAWYGADGENYIRGLQGLARDGFLSTDGKLSYWPAGYPLLMWPLLIAFKGAFFGALAFLQSLLYAFACAFFVDELTKTRLRKFAFLTALLLTFNPTLALNTIAVGYELPTVALSLIAVAAMMRSFRLSKSRPLSIENLVASLAFMLATFMQPRLIVIGILVMGIWALAKYPIKSALVFLSFSILIMLIAPATMIYRNSSANGYATISTNLGVTMGIGAGPEATGGYNGKYNGVDCPEAKSAKNPAQADSANVRCILEWYLANPGPTLKLFWNKARFFWSPWYGPEANGTMARNPWRVNHPFNETLKTQEGSNLILGGFGKFVSWSWMMLNLGLLVFGFIMLFRVGGLERLVGLVSIAFISLNWLSSILTIGDHRFRIPSMGLSLFLQGVGFLALFFKKRDRFQGSSPKVEWDGLHWKAKSKTDNLPS